MKFKKLNKILLDSTQTDHHKKPLIGPSDHQTVLLYPEVQKDCAPKKSKKAYDYREGNISAISTKLDRKSIGVLCTAYRQLILKLRS